MPTGMVAYDTGVSEEVQGNINNICNELMAVLTGHDSDVASFQNDFTATGVSDSYASIESRFGSAGTAVADMIVLVRKVLNLNDGTAVNTVGNAQRSVDNIC